MTSGAEGKKLERRQKSEVSKGKAIICCILVVLALPLSVCPTHFSPPIQKPGPTPVPSSMSIPALWIRLLKVLSHDECITVLFVVACFVLLNSTLIDHHIISNWTG